MIYQQVKTAKSKAVEILSHHNIHDTFTVKVKKPKLNNWVAMYRAGSQFRNGGRGPIFWLSNELLTDKRETVISILHEYGHVIAEFFYFTRKPELINLISDNWVGVTYHNTIHVRGWDEESFAEDFAQYLYNGKLMIDKYKAIDDVILAYLNEMSKSG